MSFLKNIFGNKNKELTEGIKKKLNSELLDGNRVSCSIYVDIIFK